MAVCGFYSALLVNQPSIARPWLILTLQPWMESCMGRNILAAL